MGRLFLVPAWLAIQGVVFAQGNAVVQQPVAGALGIQSEVAVPDRGEAKLGGTSTSAVGRNQLGTVPSGTSTGKVTAGSAGAVGAYIHNFDDFDEVVSFTRPPIPGIDKPGGDDPESVRIMKARSRVLRLSNSPMLQTPREIMNVYRRSLKF
ncbi:hypothetical protein SH668x_002906 [Planctomicrobium sp. SH668]|uniref:hypothetical protein n=1 Tax=Planctomicrobium sp. SH668 TaxID=3448126 RepID=UPI003F5B8465